MAMVNSLFNQKFIISIELSDKKVGVKQTFKYEWPFCYHQAL